MLILMKMKTAMLAGALATPILATAFAPAPPHDQDGALRLASTSFSYRAAGDFSQAGRPVEGPLRELRLPVDLLIMKRQVTVAEYARCVDEAACPRIAIPAGAAGRTRRRRQLARCLGLRRMAVAQDRYHPSSADRRGVDIRSRREGARRSDAARRPLRSGAGLDRPLRSRICPLQAGRDGRSAWRHVRHQQQRAGRSGRQCLGVDE